MSLIVKIVQCGDGHCDASESCTSCYSDCKSLCRMLLSLFSCRFLTNFQHLKHALDLQHALDTAIAPMAYVYAPVITAVLLVPVIRKANSKVFI